MTSRSNAITYAVKEVVFPNQCRIEMLSYRPLEKANMLRPQDQFSLRPLF